MLVTGMCIGTLFTLIILPALYSLLAEDRHGKAPVEEAEESTNVRAHLPTR
jgi:hypothetical protein